MASTHPDHCTASNLRTFCLCLILFTAAGILPAGGEDKSGAIDVARDESWKDPELKDIQIRLESIPGSYYESEIPATLDLVDRAELSIQSMTRLVNPDFDYAQFSYVILNHDPPYKAMEAGITNLNPKWLEDIGRSWKD